MEETRESSRLRRSQRDYSLSFKIMVVEEVEKGYLSAVQAQEKYGIQGHATVLAWLRKYGKLNWRSGSAMKQRQTPYKEIKDLKKRIKELELEKDVLNKVIDIADDQLGANIRKKLLAPSSDIFKRRSQEE